MTIRKLWCERGSIAQQTNDILDLLKQGDPMSVQELMNELKLTKKEVLTSLDRLERQGEIERKKGEYRTMSQEQTGNGSD